MTTERRVGQVSVDALRGLESRLDRSFAACVASYVATSILLIILLGVGHPPAWAVIVALVAAAGLLAGYVWFAVEVARSARALGKGPVPYLLWMIAAPVVALVPIPVLSLLIAASPLSLKFLLARQLRAAIQERIRTDMGES
jgi:hypothetical protein